MNTEGRPRIENPAPATEDTVEPVDTIAEAISEQTLEPAIDPVDDVLLQPVAEPVVEPVVEPGIAIGVPFEPARPVPTWTATIGTGIARPFRRVFHRHTSLLDKIAFVLVGLLILLAVVGIFYQPYDPFNVDTNIALQPPGPAHWLGTDDVGRDVLSRILAGAGLTLLSAAAIVLIAAIIGVFVASVSALLPKWADEIVMRACDIFMSIPSLVLALGLAAALGPSLTSIIIAMVVASWPSTARLTRGILRETMTTSYVESARILGVSRVRLMLRHVLPNSLDAIYVQASMEISGTIVMISGLAFLGVGAPPPSPDWGSMIAAGQQYITTAWWISLFPGLAITIGAIAFGLVGDAVRSFVDPASRRS